MILGMILIFLAGFLAGTVFGVWWANKAVLEMFKR